MCFETGASLRKCCNAKYLYEGSTFVKVLYMYIYHYYKILHLVQTVIRLQDWRRSRELHVRCLLLLYLYLVLIYINTVCNIIHIYMYIIYIIIFYSFKHKQTSSPCAPNTKSAVSASTQASGISAAETTTVMIVTMHCNVYVGRKHVYVC